MEQLYIPVFLLILINLLIYFAGYINFRKKLVWMGWGMLLLSLPIIYFVFIDQNPVLMMLALISTTFTGMKVIVSAELYRMKERRLNLKKWALFCFGWAGMQAQPFEQYGGKSLESGWTMIGFGVKRIVAGILLLFLAHQLVSLNADAILIYWLTSIVLLIAFSLILHFGLLSISAGGWRLQGVDVGYLFKSPLKSNSLTDFWSKRWNLAFSEMIALAVFRPLKNKTGQPAALFAGFAFSGILHELALSVPVNTGYGLPFLYFLLHGCLVLLEKVLLSNRIHILQNRVIGKIWTLFWVIIPAPLLFHHAFIDQIVWPLAGLSH